MQFFIVEFQLRIRPLPAAVHEQKVSQNLPDIRRRFIRPHADFRDPLRDQT